MGNTDENKSEDEVEKEESNSDDSISGAAPKTNSEPDLSPNSKYGNIDESTLDEHEKEQLMWLRGTYQGDTVPQLTLRAVLMGGFLGSLMSISNLYTTLKIGWSFGVAITACVLSFVIWRSITIIFSKLPFGKVSQMTILETNAMQCTASAAGYSTGSTIGTAFAALLLINGVHIGCEIVLPWTLVSAGLGVFLAVPMKRQMINREKLPFPDGIAAAQTLRSLYSESKEAVSQAYALVAALGAGLLVGFLKSDFYKFLSPAKLPELIPFSFKLGSLNMSKMPGFGFDPSVLLIGAGMIVGLRVSLSMLVSALILYLWIGPWMISVGEIQDPSKLLRWSLWPGTAIMVASGLTSFALQWRTIVNAFGSVKAAMSGEKTEKQDLLEDVEVPIKILIIGIIPLTILMVALQLVAFSISIPLGLLAVVMSFFLALVACRATGETNITPIGAMGKITQLTYAALAPSNITTNLMAASVTANIASSSADLLTDLKSGYLLGANARKQFYAQFIGVFFGTAAIVPAWFLMVPNKEALDKFNPPAANMWRAVAEALAHGLDYVPELARIGILIGALLGIMLAVIDHYASDKVKKYIPSAMGLGLAWVVWFSNCLSFFIGAMIAFIWSKINKESASLYVIPAASGAVAGESLMAAAIAMITAAKAIGAF